LPAFYGTQIDHVLPLGINKKFELQSHFCIRIKLNLAKGLEKCRVSFGSALLDILKISYTWWSLNFIMGRFQP
jgi:hypothetical protein